VPALEASSKVRVVDVTIPSGLGVKDTAWSWLVTLCAVPVNV
jgi:hypothetical protein